MRQKKESPTKGKAIKEQSKDNHFEAQKQRVYKAFDQPKTMLMVSVETGILRANVCRFISRWKQENCIYLIKEDLCKISKHKAGYYCTSSAIVEPLKDSSDEK